MAINYKELVLKTENEVTTKTKKKTTTKKPTVEYIVDGVSGCDIVITKKTAKKEQQLVCLMSQQQLYVKDIKEDKITMADPDVINTFFSGLEEALECVDAEGNRLNWTSKFYKGMNFARTLCRLVEHKGIHEYVKKGLFAIELNPERKVDYIRDDSGDYDIRIISQIYNLIPDSSKASYIDEISKRLIGMSHYQNNNSQKIRSVLNYISKSNLYAGRENWEEPIQKNYGLSGIKRVIEEYFQTAVESFPDVSDLVQLFGGQGSWRLGNASHGFNFDLSSFIHYLFYSSVEQGYAGEIGNFIDLWKDSLIMEDKIFKHGVQNKYPENLASHHQVLCYKYELLKQEINEKEWAKQSKRFEKFERNGEKYSIVAPKTPNDMIEEARQQSNCLSSYVQRVIDGECMIFFLRKTQDIDKSLVTIEIRQDGSLGQVKAKYNHEPSAEERDYVDKWYKEKVVKLLAAE